MIEIGQQYIRCVGMNEGDLEESKFHMECHKPALDMVQEVVDGFMPYENPRGKRNDCE